MKTERDPALAKSEHSLIVRLARARFFVISMVLHGVIVLTFGGTVLFNKFVEPSDFTGGDPGSFLKDEGLPPPPPEQPLLQDQQLTPTQVTATTAVPAPSLQAITSAAPSLTAFSIPIIAPAPANAATVMSQPTTVSAPAISGGLSKEIAAGIAGFTAGWSKGGSGGRGSSVRNREFQFTAYLAKYAEGDWDSTVRIEAQQIVAGSLPNLLFVMRQLSSDRIKAAPEAVPLDLASEEIFAKRPPFIWFTGHRDFKLTDREVENLQKYIRMGGCIWGDSSLPGQRSRFDIAFRREMRRVIPDINKQWKTLPTTHPVYTAGYFPEIKDVPPGLNFYREPVYTIESYGGEIGIIYTANDYGDMWQFGVDERGEIDLRRDEKHRMVAVNEGMWHRRNVFFRNIEAKALFDTYKFGTNMVVHLLTRWEDKVRFAPKGL